MAINQTTTDKKVMYLPKTLAQKISRYRFGNEIRAESEAIRRLIEKGLEAVEAEGPKDGGATH